MAAAIKALNARIRSNPVTDYFCSTRESPPIPKTRSSDLGGLAAAHEEGGQRERKVCSKAKRRVLSWDLGILEREEFGRWCATEQEC